MRTNRVINTLLMMSLLSFSFTSHADIEEVVEKSFTVKNGSQLSLENINGSVDIKGWDQNVIKVTATIKADDQDARDRISIDMQHTNNRLAIETHYEKNKSWGFSHNNSGQVSYEVMVPFNTELSPINLVNGSLRFNEVKGNIIAELVNGSVNASDLKGSSQIESVNGSIKISYGELGNDFDHIKLATVNGSIKVTLPENVSASVVASTSHGSIKDQFGLPAPDKGFMGKTLEGKIGEGKAKISLESINGSIKIMKD